MTLGAFSTMRCEVRGDVELTLLEQVPVGLVLDLALFFGRVGIGRDRVGDSSTLDTDVRGVAEEQAEQRTSRIALGFLESADADEERARDDAAEVEDDRADRHGGQVIGGRGDAAPQGPSGGQHAA